MYRTCNRKKGNFLIFSNCSIYKNYVGIGRQGRKYCIGQMYTSTLYGEVNFPNLHEMNMLLGNFIFSARCWWRRARPTSRWGIPMQTTRAKRTKGSSRYSQTWPRNVADSRCFVFFSFKKRRRAMCNAPDVGRGGCIVVVIARRDGHILSDC
jgi:hypothetical protein